MPTPPHSRRLPLLSVLLGLLVAGLSLISFWSLERMTPQYARLVAGLESGARSPGQTHPALDHARASLADLRARDAARWEVGGYAFTHTVGILLGVALVALGFRARTGEGTSVAGPPGGGG